MVFYIPTVETASDAAATEIPAEADFPCHRSNAMNGKTAFVLLSGVLSGSLCACVQPPEAAAPAAPPPRTGAGTDPSPGSRADAQQPLGQYPGGDVRKAAGVVARRPGRGIPVLYRLSGSAVR